MTTLKAASTLSNREYLALVVPFILSTMTQPLMRAVNTAVMGHMADPAYIAGVSLGVVLFNNLYWMFGFLRVSTSGFTAQALGARSPRQELLAFVRPLMVAVCISLVFILFQQPILNLYLQIMAPEPHVSAICVRYCRILIWGAPCVLINYVILGWLMGAMLVRATLMMQMSTNFLNILLSLLFVSMLHLDVEGVAWATLLSQVYGLLVGIMLLICYGKLNFKLLCRSDLLDKKSLTEMCTVNGNLMLRCFFHLAINNGFTGGSVMLGTVMVAADAVLQQAQQTMSYMVDGLANGASIFAGRAVGAKDKKMFDAGLRLNFRWGVSLAFCLCCVYWIFDRTILGWITDLPQVLQTALPYSFFVAAYPFACGMGIILYGVFTGATDAFPISLAMFVSAVFFYVVRAILLPLFGNYGLWITFEGSLLVQGLVLYLSIHHLRRRHNF